MDTTIIELGLSLMLYGMGMVFVFLTVLIVCTSLMSSIIQRYFPEPEPAVSASSPMQATVTVDNKSLEIIRSAIAMHRGKRK